MSPGQYFNQHSFTISAVGSLLLLTIWLLRDGVKAADLVAIGALLIGLVAAYVLFGPGPSSVTEADQLRARIGAGTPVLLEFQSPF